MQNILIFVNESSRRGRLLHTLSHLFMLV